MRGVGRAGRDWSVYGLDAQRRRLCLSAVNTLSATELYP